MKRIILLFAAALMVGTIFAQTSKQINFQSIEKKLQKSNADIENPKKSSKYQTWISRGELMLEIYDAMLLSANSGMTMAEFNIIVGQGNEKTEEEIDGQMVTKVSMDRVTFFFINDVLEYWTFNNNIIEDPLDKAYASFMKSQELDSKGKSVTKVKDNLTRLKYIYVSEGSNCYTKKEYDCSFKNFARAIEVGELPTVNHVDTIIIFYAGLSAQVGKNFENAIEYYKKALDYKFYSEGNIYYNIFEAYTSLERSEEGLKFLEEGFLKFPNNQSVLYGLINYYINKGDDPKIVLDYIHKAMEVEPNEFSLYFAEGTLYDRLNNFEEAEKSYMKSIELNPKFFDALFNLGALYFNAGVKFLEEANKVPAREVEKYDALIEQSNAEFRKSIPYIERAYEVSPEGSAIETLRNLYFRFRNDNEEMQKKYDEINEKWDSMKE
ncbi:MAG: hypothetical protein CVT98_01440 [Bacteroidetes bacterium HGW-Bacteroidetes-15]|nr:MAG: hypothetical protein CVT98_01440 [Bacteroidetes bacterium HGW-Bacteroidetes-15]